MKSIVLLCAALALIPGLQSRSAVVLPAQIPIQPGTRPVPIPEIETPGIEVDPVPIQPGVKPVPIPEIETPGIEVDPVPIQPGVKPVP
ncbi:unnamed protein product, partial [Tenebrio molitor]